jgi:hypothetical protein
MEVLNTYVHAIRKSGYWCHNLFHTAVVPRIISGFIIECRRGQTQQRKRERRSNQEKTGTGKPRVCAPVTRFFLQVKNTQSKDLKKLFWKLANGFKDNH